MKIEKIFYVRDDDGGKLIWPKQGIEVLCKDLREGKNRKRTYHYHQWWEILDKEIVWCGSDDDGQSYIFTENPLSWSVGLLVVDYSYMLPEHCDGKFPSSMTMFLIEHTEVCSNKCDDKIPSSEFTLNMVDKGLINIPTSIDDRVTSLDLSENRIKYVAFSRISGGCCDVITELNLADNEIKLAKDDKNSFPYMPELRILNLSGNPTYILPNWLADKCPKLEVLDLSETFIDKTDFKDFKNLKGVNLSTKRK